MRRPTRSSKRRTVPELCAVVAAPIYNQESLIGSAVDSLLAQTLPNLALVLVDDCSTDGTGRIAQGYAARDPRVTYLRNERRLGMLLNTRRALSIARARFPQARYIALGSDHDWWHPEWLASLSKELDHAPDAVLAYPLIERISLTGKTTRGPWRFDTSGIEDPRARLRASFRGSAGEMIYGLFRASALDRVGLYRSVLVPDRLLLAELALQGRFRQVDRVLWRRRLALRGDLNRQRQLFFMDGIPLAARLPWVSTHAAVLAVEYSLRGKGRPQIGRAAGLAVTFDYLRTALWRRLRNRLVDAARSLARRPIIRQRLLSIQPPDVPRARWAYQRLLHDDNAPQPAVRP